MNPEVRKRLEMFYGTFNPNRLQKPRPRASEKAENKKKALAHKLAVYRHVDVRDGYKCRATGKRVDPRASSMLDKGHHHEIRFRSLGGKIETSNVVLLSAEAHADVHAGRLIITGDANGVLTFERDGKVWTA